MSRKVSIAGEPGPDLPTPSDRLPDTTGIDRLASAESEEAYQQELIRILREENAVDTEHVAIPHKPGITGVCTRILRTALWKLFRYQHEQMAIRHNAIHARLAAALEYEHDRNRQRIAALEQRIAALEKSAPTETP